MRWIEMSPDGRHYFSVVPSGRQFLVRVHAFEPDEKQKLFYGAIPIPSLNSIAWTNNERIVMEANEIGFMGRLLIRKPLILAVDYDGTAVETLWRSSAKKPAAVAGPGVIINLLPKVPEQILIKASEDGESYPGVHRLDVYSAAMTEVVEGKKFLNRWVINQNGDVLMGAGWDENDLHIAGRPDSDSEWKKWSFEGSDAPYRFSPVLVTTDDGIVQIVRDSLNGPDAIYEFDLQSGTFNEKVYQHASSDVHGILVSPLDGRHLAYTVATDRSEYDFIDDEFAEIYEAINDVLPGKVNWISNISPDERFFIVLSYSDTHPGAYYRFDRQEKELMAFGLQNDKLNPDYLAPTQSISYMASDGLKIPAYLTLPKGVDPEGLPFVMLPHGGPAERDYLAYDFTVQFLVSRGYGVMQFDYRGSGGYGFSYEALGFGEWGHRVQDDLVDAVRYLVTEGLADEDRICIYGASYGGYMALVASYRDTEIFKCAIAYAPVTDLKLYKKRLKNEKFTRYSKLVFEKMSSKKFKAANPIDNVKQVSIPILMIHGKHDRIVSVEHSRRFDTALSKRGKDIKYIELADEGHDLWFAKTRTRLLKELESFLKDHIGQGAKTSFVSN